MWVAHVESVGEHTLANNGKRWADNSETTTGLRGKTSRRQMLTARDEEHHLKIMEVDKCYKCYSHTRCIYTRCTASGMNEAERTSWLHVGPWLARYSLVALPMTGSTSPQRMCELWPGEDMDWCEWDAALPGTTTGARWEWSKLPEHVSFSKSGSPVWLTTSLRLKHRLGPIDCRLNYHSKEP